MRRRSLSRRAVALVLISELLCAIAFSLTSLWHERRIRMRAMDTQLQGRSDSLLGAIQDAEDPDDNVMLDREELSLPGEDAWAVYSGQGKLLGRSGDPTTYLTGTHGSGMRDVRSGRREFRVIERQGLRIIDRDETGGIGLRRPVTIVYATPMRHLNHEIWEAAEFYIAISLLLLLASGVILILSLRKLLQPLDELAACAAGVGTRSEMFTPPQSALEIRELRPLAEALSASIGRLRHALDLQHRFVSDAAHELKTAVAVVRSSVQLLRLRERTRDEYVHGLDRVVEDNQRVEQLVLRMLTLGRYEEQHGDDRGATDLTASVERTLESLTPWTESRGVHVMQTAKGLLRVALAEDAADTLVSNLVMNAVQHSPAGAEVRVRVDQDSDPANEILLTVEDHGAGIPPESLPHVFERFYRDDRSRSRQTGGAGLGLAICKSIVEGAGGAIRIASELGKGTSVTARLKAAPAPGGFGSEGSTPPESLQDSKSSRLQVRQ